MFKRIVQHKEFIPTVISIVVLLTAACLFFAPLLKGKKLAQSDFILVKGMMQNLEEYRAEHPGEDALWSSSMFSGMPAYTIHIQYGGNILRPIWKAMNLGNPNPIGYLFWGMLSFFALLRVYKVETWLAAAGGLAFGFFSYHIIITEAGHLSKLVALLIAPSVLLSVAVAFKGRILLGSALLFFTMGLELLANHVQMTYYLAFVVLAYGIYELVEHIRAGKAVQFGLAVASMGVAVGLAVLINLSHILPMYEYQKYSIRGPSELQKEPSEEATQKQKSKAEAQGLDKEYAYAWSNGRDELLTLLIPNMKGGSSNGYLTKNMQTYKTIEQINPDYLNMRLPFYWGTQSFTSGPTYAGAIICFLFVVGLLLVSSGVKWALLYATLVIMLLSLGKNSFALPAALVLLAIPIPYMLNLEILRKNLLFSFIPIVVGGILVLLLDDDPAKSFTIKDLFFDNLPLYNKFRAPASMLAIVAFTMPWLALLGAQALMDNKLEKSKKLQALYIALGVVGGLCLLLAFAPGVFYTNFKSPNDAALEGQQALYKAILTDRESMLSGDALRSLGFIVVAAGIIWAYVNQYLKNSAIVGIALLILVGFDLYTVDKRYLSTDEFQTESEFEQNFEPMEADQFLKQHDKGYYRVFPMSRNAFNDGRTPYHLKTIGGYNAAKIKRYQQLVEAHISKLTPNVINMLNTEYLIYNKELPPPVYVRLHRSRDGEMVFKNQFNYGPAWICKDVLVVPKPDDALARLDKIYSYDTAIVEQKDANKIGNISRDSVNRETETIKLKKADNRYMEYEYQSDKSRFVTFSEVYYEKGWQAFIDGKEVPILHTNFVLRGLVVPAGKHSITFKYDPEVLHKGTLYSQIGSGLLILVMFAAIGFEIRNANQAPKDKRSTKAKSGAS